MGYTTTFKLSSNANPDDYELRDKIVTALEKESKYDHWYFPSYEEGKIVNSDISWYSHMEDMVRLSMLFPTITFELEGEGEDQGDHWKAYFKDGLSVKYNAIITFPLFNPGDMT